MESRLVLRDEGRRKRTLRTRRRIQNGGRLRLSIYRSLKHLYAQIIDDSQGRTLAAVSTLDPEARALLPRGATKAGARWIGQRIAKLAAEKGITEVVFDRGFYLYHGRIKELAEAAREAGLKF